MEATRASVGDVASISRLPICVLRKREVELGGEVSLPFKCAFKCNVEAKRYADGRIPSHLAI